VVLTFDGKGVVLHREDLREATRKAAERRRQQGKQPSSRGRTLWSNPNGPNRPR